MGRTVGVKVTIYQYSTDEDRQLLVDAFKKGQNQGLVDALSKMKSVGRIAITGTVGYDLSYIRLIPTSTGRKIRFVTNRLIRFGEAYYNTRTIAYNLTAGEFDIIDSDTDRSSGVLYPASQLIVNKDGQLEFQLNQNPWKLVNIIDWHKAGYRQVEMVAAQRGRHAPVFKGQESEASPVLCVGDFSGLSVSSA